jgi:hypothetical protein
MFSKVLRLILCNQIVQGADHVRLETVVLLLDGFHESRNAHDVSKVDVESRQTVDFEAMDLGNVVFVAIRNTGRGAR